MANSIKFLDETAKNSLHQQAFYFYAIYRSSFSIDILSSMALGIILSLVFPICHQTVNGSLKNFMYTKYK